MANIIKAYTPVTAGYHSKEEISSCMIIQEYIEKHGIQLVGPYICVINNNPVSRIHWDSIIMQEDDIVLFLAFPQGGGEGGSSPMKAILTIGLMAAALTIPGLNVLTYGGIFLYGGTTGAAMMSGAIMFGGSYLLNLAFPPSIPNQGDASSDRAGTSSSSYNINDRGNTAALGNVITVQYGRMKHYPKYAMQSWAEYINNEQYAHLLFCQGQGEYYFEEYNFGTVASTDLSDCEITVFEKDAKINFATDGSEWERKTAASSFTGDFNGIAKKQEIYVAVGETGEIQTSIDDGDTWIAQTAAGSYADDFTGVACDGDVFIAVGETGEIQVSSDNGDTWVAKTAAGSYTGTFNAIATDGTIFIAVGSGGEIQVSADQGDTWTAKTPDASFADDFTCVTHDADDDYWMIAGGDGGTTPEVQLSTDSGDTWTQRTAPPAFTDGYITGIAYGNGVWVITVSPTTAAPPELHISSNNGLTWSIKETEETTNSNLTDVTYVGTTFIAIGFFGQIHTSADYGSSWQQQDYADDADTTSVTLKAICEDMIVGGRVLISIGAAPDIEKGIGGAYAYNNVFTSDQVQNVDVKRVEDYEVTATYTGLLGVPLNDGEALRVITATVYPANIPFSNGVFGNDAVFDGFIAGDSVELYQSWGFVLGVPGKTFSEYKKTFKIKSSYYTTISGVSMVAYEFEEDMATVDELNNYSLTYLKNGTTLAFVPTTASSGYLVPNTNSVIQKVSVDIVFPQGLYSVNTTTGGIETSSVDFTIEYKEIPASGVEPGTWSDTGALNVSGALRFPVRKTYDIPITDPLTKKVRVRINRDYGTASEYADSNKDVNSMVFESLKVFLEDTERFGEVTMIAVKVKTTDSLVQATLSQFNTVSTRKLPIYATSWSAPTATRNPAWAIADACRNSEYSLGIADENIDLDELVRLAAIWESRNDYCDGLFENKEVFWDALRKICKVGRAQPLMVAGSVGFVRDEPKTIPTQVFTSENIQSESFNVDYIPFDDDTPNSVELEYFDEDEWIWKKTLQTITGGSTDKPASLKPWGITNEAHAIREAKYEAACNAYRRKIPSFTTELEGRILKRLDFISVSSPRVGWGTSGRVTDVTSNTLTLSEPVTFETGTNYIAFRKKNGQQDGPYEVTEVTGEPKKVLMGVTPPSHIYTGYEYEKTHFQFGLGEEYHKEALVTTIQPQQLESVQISCVIDDPRVYTEDGTIVVDDILTDEVTTLKFLQHDTDGISVYNSFVMIDTTHFILAYTNVDGDGIIKTFSINSLYEIEEINKYSHDSVATVSENSLVMIDATHFALNYMASNVGTMKVFEIDANYENIVQVGSTTTWGVAGTGGNNGPTSFHKIDATHFMLTYTGAGTDGYARVFSMNASTYVFTQGDFVEFDPSEATYMSSAELSEGLYVAAWQGNSAGRVSTIAVSGAYAITEPSTYQFSTADARYNSICKLDDTHFVVAFENQGTSSALVKVFSIGASPTYTITEESSESHSTSGSSFSVIGIDDTHFALAYQGVSNAGILKVFEVDPDNSYAITLFETVTFAEIADISSAHSLLKIDFNHYILAHSESIVSNPGGYIRTFEIASISGYIDAITGEPVVDIPTPPTDEAEPDEPVTEGIVYLERLIHETPCVENSMIKLDATHFLLAYAGANRDGYLKVIELTGDTPSEVSGSRLKHGAGNGAHSSLIEMSAGVYALAHGEKNNDGGWVSIFTIDASYVITEVGTLNHDSVIGLHHSLVRIDNTHFMLAYSGEDTWGNGVIKTFSFTAGSPYVITEEDSLTHDTIGEYNSLIQIDATHYMLAYSGESWDGYLKTFTIDGTFQITQTHSNEHDETYTGSHSLVKIDATHYALAYAQGTTTHTSYFKIFELNGTTYETTQLSSKDFETGYNFYNSLILIDSTSFVLMCTDTDNDGFYRLIEIDGSYVITSVDYSAHDTFVNKYNSAVKIDSTNFIVAYTGLIDRGYIKTFEII